MFRYVLRITFILIISIIFIVCNSEQKKSEVGAVGNGMVSENNLLALSKEKAGKNVGFAVEGRFNSDNTGDVFAVKDIVSEDTAGIQFVCFELKQAKDEYLFESKVFLGALAESRIEVIPKSGENYSYLYYNSGDFFLGSSVGEIFSYLVDAGTKEVYSAHLFFSSTIKPSVYLSENITDKKVQEFLLGQLRKDFPHLLVTEKDHQFLD